MSIQISALGPCIGAEVDGKCAVAAQSRLVRNIGNPTLPGICHGVDAVCAHDQSGRIDLGGRLRDLDLRRLQIAELGAIIRRGPMARESDIIIQTGLRVAQADT